MIEIKTLGAFEGCPACAALCEECLCPNDTVCEDQTAVFDIVCNVSAEGNNVARLFLSFPSIDTDGTMSFQLHQHASGVARCEIGMRDALALDGTSRAALSGRHVFLITILPVNDAPDFELISNEIFMLEDQGSQEIAVARAIFADGVNGTTEVQQNVVFSVEAMLNAQLLSSYNMSSEGLLMLHTFPDAFGHAQLRLTLTGQSLWLFSI